MRVRGYKRTLVGLSAGVLLFASSCKHQTTENRGRTKDADVVVASPSSGPTPEQASAILARVGDRAITVGDYAAALQRMDRFERLRYQSPDRRKQLLDELVAIELLADEARRQGLESEPDTQLRLDQAIRDEVLSNLRAGAPTPDSLPEAEVRAYYDAHQEEFKEPERRRIAEVVVARAEEARRVIDAARGGSPQDWGRLVRKYASGRTDANPIPLELEGDLGIVSTPGEGTASEAKIPDAVAKAAFFIDKVGGVFEEPVLVHNQWHVVRLSSRVQARQRTFAEAERSIRVKLVQQRIEASQKKLLDDLRKRIPVAVNQTLLATIKLAPK